MTARTITLGLCLTALAAGAALAQDQSANTPQPARVDTQRPAPPQQPATAPAPGIPAPAAAPAPKRQGQPINVKIDVTITDQHGGAAPALKKTVSVVTADLMNGFIRSTANYSNIGDVPLNVDVFPELIADGKIRVGVNLQYDLPGSASKPVGDKQGEEGSAGWLRRTQIRENLAVILENGKSVSVAQSADPVGDRQVTIDVKATILR